MSEASHYHAIRDLRRDSAIKYATIGMTVGEWRNLSDASKAEVDLLDGALIRRRAGLADDRDERIIGYSRFSPTVPGCHVSI